MDRHYLAAIIAVGTLGAMGIIAGTALICVMKDPLAGAACIGLGSSALTGILGAMVAPAIRVAPAPGSPPPLSPEAAAFAAALGGAVNTLK